MLLDVGKRQFSQKLSSLILVVIMVTGGISFAIPGIIPEAEAEPFIAEVRYVGFNFAPRGWASCDGQLLSIASNTALFSILGTTFGGDGRTTFGLPDLQGRFLMHPGNGPGLSSHNLGEKGGTNTVTLSLANLPVHSHTVFSDANTDPIRSEIFVTSASGNTILSTGNSIGLGFARTFSNILPLSQMNSNSISVNAVTDATGSSDSVDNMPPYLALQCTIATQGLFPSRN